MSSPNSETWVPLSQNMISTKPETTWNTRWGCTAQRQPKVLCLGINLGASRLTHREWWQSLHLPRVFCVNYGQTRWAHLMGTLDSGHTWLLQVFAGSWDQEWDWEPLGNELGMVWDWDWESLQVWRLAQWEPAGMHTCVVYPSGWGDVPAMTHIYIYIL